MTQRYKYDRTFHVPWSKGLGNDDKLYTKVFGSLSKHFGNKEIVLTTKMDGENSALYADQYSHARSMDSPSHESRNWLKQFWAERSYNLPENWRIYGENLFAFHSIAYNELPSYFMAFSIYDENNMRLHWDDFTTFCELLNVEHVPVLYRGIFDEKLFQSMCEALDTEVHEGIVCTTVEGFHYKDMSKNLCKFVRENHVQSDEHWKTKPIIPNKLKND